MEYTMIKHVLIALSLLSLAACETAKGAGRDINKAGTALEQAADDIQKKL
jgi:entericidin B